MRSLKKKNDVCKVAYDFVCPVSGLSSKTPWSVYLNKWKVRFIQAPPPTPYFLSYASVFIHHFPSTWRPFLCPGVFLGRTATELHLSHNFLFRCLRPHWLSLLWSPILHKLLLLYVTCQLLFKCIYTHLTGKDPDAGRDWGQEEKGTTEDEMVRWHHRLDGHEFE